MIIDKIIPRCKVHIVRCQNIADLPDVVLRTDRCSAAWSHGVEFSLNRMIEFKFSESSLKSLFFS